MVNLRGLCNAERNFDINLYMGRSWSQFCAVAFCTRTNSANKLSGAEWAVEQTQVIGVVGCSSAQVTVQAHGNQRVVQGGL